MMEGIPADQILKVILAEDPNWDWRQYGIADGKLPVGFTGMKAGVFKNDIQNVVDGRIIAIQGNVLAGSPVLWQAMIAVNTTEGTLADRLMAGMEAARAYGGDGRCSCPNGEPNACGSPPASFNKTAHCAFMIVARIGDTDGTCGGSTGCGNGDYYMTLNVADQNWSYPDPVFQLQDQFDVWRAGLAGQPDGVRSLATLDDAEVLGDGASNRTIRVALHDLDGAPLTHGGNTLTVAHAPGSAGLAAIGQIRNNGDGTYDVRLRAGRGTGTDRFEITAEGTGARAVLYPYPELTHREALRADPLILPAGEPVDVAFDLLGPTDAAGRGYVLGLSLGGTRPGQPLPGGAWLPLNPGRLWLASLVPGGHPLLDGGAGLLDDQARALVRLEADPGALAVLAGLELSAAWFTTEPSDFSSNAVTLVVES
jgi:uncharacterized Ntn-hydrolase superfamily protein